MLRGGRLVLRIYAIGLAQMGLGLLLARRILEAHRGSLEIESQPGQGAVARVRVPLADMKAHADALQAPAS